MTALCPGSRRVAVTSSSSSLGRKQKKNQSWGKVDFFNFCSGGKLRRGDSPPRPPAGAEPSPGLPSARRLSPGGTGHENEKFPHAPPRGVFAASCPPRGHGSTARSFPRGVPGCGGACLARQPQVIREDRSGADPSRVGSCGATSGRARASRHFLVGTLLLSLLNTFVSTFVCVFSLSKSTLCSYWFQEREDIEG